MSVGPQFVAGRYREVSNDLSFVGTGFGAAASFSWKKLALDVAYASVSYDRQDESVGEDFTAKQFDAQLSYHVAGPVRAEVGVTNRKADPEFAAQSAGAVRLGARMSQPIAEATRLSLRANYLAGAKFSGGGEAPFGLEIALGVSLGFARDRFRLSADYEFQHFGRKTDDGSGEVNVPIQQSLLRFGANVGF